MVTVILNRTAGSAAGEDIPSRLAGLFDSAGVPARVASFASAADAAAAARTAANGAGDGDAVVACGGDGTVSTVASVLVGSPVRFGVIPLGTLNHFAKDAGIPLDLEGAVTTVAGGRTRAVDVGEVNGRHFLNNISIGIYPDIVVERESLRGEGYRKWAAFAVATARVIGDYRGLVVQITADDKTVITRTPFLLVGNNEYHTEGVHLGARERLDSGRLFAYFAPSVRSRELPRLFASALIGRASEQRTLQALAAPELRAETAQPRDLRVAVDGEIIVMRTPLLFRTRPRALQLLVPAA